MYIKNKISRFLRKFKIGTRILDDRYFKSTAALSKIELSKEPSRTEIINFLLTLTKAEYYLEIGVRKPEKNFNKIKCKNKYSVDPGVEFKENPVEFKMTSDVFFSNLEQHKINSLSGIKFDVIFIDGLHISGQAERDILNSLQYIKEDGFIVLHDCSPPSEFHQRECFEFKNSPAGPYWNGTTWKAFYKYRHSENLFSICFDTDWGVGVLSKRKMPLFNNIKKPIVNEFYEYAALNENRKEFLNLTLFEEWKKEL